MLIVRQETLTSWFALEEPMACCQPGSFVFMYCEPLSGLTTGPYCGGRCCAN